MAKFKITWNELNDESKLKARIGEEIKVDIKFDANRAVKKIIEETKNDSRLENVRKITEADKKMKRIKSLIAYLTMELVKDDKTKIDELNKALGITTPNTNIQINYSEIAAKIYEQNNAEFSLDYTAKPSSSGTAPTTAPSASAKIAVISDIHSNLQAFQAVLADIAKQGISDSNIYCCGDIVGYGGNPNECVELIQRKGIKCVLGNHDAEVRIGEDKWHIPERNYNPEISSMFKYHKKAISSESKKVLDNLEFTLEVDDFIIVHGELTYPKGFSYIIPSGYRDYNPEFVIRNFRKIEERKKKLCFIGHLHIPFVVLNNQQDEIEWKQKDDLINAIDLKSAKLAIVNVGSVGQPRDGNNKACYAIYDKENGKIEIRYVRVHYDISEAQKAIRDRISEGYDEDVANKMADRLENGQ